ncbi:MAG: carboxymuconolactone decarboxylase family protein, partial [Planctomycetia bacterium]
PLAESSAPEKVQQTLGRLKDALGVAETPAVFLNLGHVPALLQDFYMNVKKFVFTDGKLPIGTKLLLAAATAGVQKNKPLVAYFSEQAEARGAAKQTVVDALGIAATCAMYNVFFKFRDISGVATFEGLPVGLRAHAFAGTSLDDKTVELINVVVSDVNGCKPCTSGHVAKARDLGLGDEAILEAIQVAATVTAATAFLSAVE